MSRPVRQARSVARLTAVQALYQMEVSGGGVETVVREFHKHRFGGDVEGVRLAPADESFFGDLVRGVVAAQTDIDKAITQRLSEGWRLERLDATARAILRCGTLELLHFGHVPHEVVIDEYVEIAKSFFAGAETGFINAALDGIAHDARPA